jgi:hypothetical protein
MPAQSALKYFVLAIAVLLLASPAFISSISTQYSHAQTRSGPIGVIIPMYAYPGSTWDSIIHVKEAYPNVPVVVVVSPSSGSGSYPDQNFVNGIRQMQSAGIEVVGYVDTMYTSVGISSAEAQVNDYNSWYRVNGIMFDDMMNTLGTENYYATLNSYTHSLGIALTMGNPGATVPPSEAGVFNILNIYESPGLPSLSNLYYNAPTSDFSLVAYGAPYSSAYIEEAANYVGYIYLTDLSYPNPWTEIPSYFTQEVALLSSLDGSGSSPTPAEPSGGASTLTVKSVNSLGNPISGYYTALYTSSGSKVSSGYTTSSYNVNDGASYQIQAVSYDACTFSHWSGGAISGSTSDPAPISISSDSTVTAVYAGSNCGAQTSSGGRTSSGGGGSATITVKSVLQNSALFKGIYVKITSSSGNVVDSGFTPLTFKGVLGDSYTVHAGNWGSYVFTNWEGSGSTNPSATITLSQNAVLTAVYNTTGGAGSNSPRDSFMTLTINSVDLNGNPFMGVWLQVRDSSGNVVAQGLTSLTLSVDPGARYTVTMSNWEYYIFRHWSGGSTKPSMTVIPTQSTVLTAYYST